MNDITRRIERLERENRYWKLGGSIAFLAVLIVIVSGANFDQDSMKLKHLAIVDDQGNNRLVLESNKHGATITGFTQDRKTSFVLETTDKKGGAHVLLFDQRGNPRLGMKVIEEDPSGGIIYFTDAEGKQTHKLP